MDETEELLAKAQKEGKLEQILDAIFDPRLDTDEEEDE